MSKKKKKKEKRKKKELFIFSVSPIIRFSGVESGLRPLSPELVWGGKKGKSKRKRADWINVKSQNGSGCSPPIRFLSPRQIKRAHTQSMCIFYIIMLMSSNAATLAPPLCSAAVCALCTLRLFLMPPEKRNVFPAQIMTCRSSSHRRLIHPSQTWRSEIIVLVNIR